jgi:hypothetical protein
VKAKSPPVVGGALADRPGEIDSEQPTGFENESQLPATVEGLPIIGADLPDWSRSVLTESQANVESNLFRWRKLIIAAPHLRANAKFVALVVADRCGDKNECAWPSLARLEGDTNLVRKTILRAVSELEARGFLAVVRKIGAANRYFPAWPAVMEAEWLLRGTGRPVEPLHPTSGTTPPHQWTGDTSTSGLVTPEVSLEVAMKSSEKCAAENASGSAPTPSSERQTKSPECSAKGREKPPTGERPEVIDALEVIAREAPAALKSDGREQVRIRLRAISNPMRAACGLTEKLRETRSLNPVARAIGYLNGCIEREPAA